MYQITKQTISADILDEMIPSNIILRDKLIRKVNEQYQYRPEVFEKVANELGVSLEKCIVFEDSPTGAKTSEVAGCKTIILTTTHQQEEFSAFSNIKLFLQDYQTLSLDQVLNL